MLRQALSIAMRSPLVWGGFSLVIAAIASGGFWLGRELCQSRMADREIAAARADAQLAKELADVRTENADAVAVRSAEMEKVLDEIRDLSLDPGACAGYGRDELREIERILERAIGPR